MTRDMKLEASLLIKTRARPLSHDSDLDPVRQGRVRLLPPYGPLVRAHKAALTLMAGEQGESMDRNRLLIIAAAVVIALLVVWYLLPATPPTETTATPPPGTVPEQTPPATPPERTPPVTPPAQPQ